MLVSHRAIIADRIDAMLATSALLHPSFRVHAVENKGVVSEDALMLRAFARLGHTGRPCVTVLLEGAARISAHENTRWLAPSSALALDYKSAIVMRQEGARYRALVLEWDDSHGDRPRPFVSIDDGSVFARADALWTALRHSSGAEASPVVMDALGAIVTALRDQGLALASPAVWTEPDPDAAEWFTLASALDRVLSAMDDQPMVVDLAESMSLSSRQLQRVVTTFHARYGFNSGTWQDTRSRRRVMMGAALMTAPKASTEYVARVVGYRSSQSFARALQMAGLPAPSEIRDEVSRMR
ncbi:MAG: helix-turn-helix transcriptional regulator [Myxococcales bacterium]|nr:helix-turn-helix transcriptional regulator [Myxococcales bacterium]